MNLKPPQYEVIIKLFDLEGVDSFKLSVYLVYLYDLSIQKLYLSEYSGVKPLYYHFDSSNKKFIFVINKQHSCFFKK